MLLGYGSNNRYRAQGRVKWMVYHSDLKYPSYILIFLV